MIKDTVSAPLKTELADVSAFLGRQLDFFMDRLVDYEKEFIPDRYNLLSRSPASQENMVNDLGDYIQYLYAADQLTGRRYEGKILTLLGWTFDEEHYDRLLSVKKKFFDSTIDTGDFLVGLNTMLHSDLPDAQKQNILTTIDRYVETFYAKDGKPVSSLKLKGFPLPVIYCYSAYNDIEELVYIYEYTNQPRYLNMAMSIYAYLSRFRMDEIPTIAFFPNVRMNKMLAFLGLNIHRTILSKTMSNYCSASIALSRHDSGLDLDRRVVTPLLRKFYDSKNKRFSTVAGRFDYNDYNLAQNHPALSLFVDYDLKTSFDYSEVINDIIHENAEHPLHYFHHKSFHLDSIVDFATILMKLHEKTGIDLYWEKAADYLAYIDRNFRTKFGFFVQGDASRIETIYSTKFQSLVLKPYILYQHVLSGGSILNDKFMFLLSRDR